MPPDSPRPGHYQGQPQLIDRRRLPAAPLVEAVRGYARRRQRPLDALMRPRLLQALQQAARVGQVTVLTGERVCDEVLGWHPRMVWGEQYDQVVYDPTPTRVGRRRARPPPTGAAAAAWTAARPTPPPSPALPAACRPGREVSARPDLTWPGPPHAAALDP